MRGTVLPFVAVISSLSYRHTYVTLHTYLCIKQIYNNVLKSRHKVMSFLHIFSSQYFKNYMKMPTNVLISFKLGTLVRHIKAY